MLRRPTSTYLTADELKRIAAIKFDEAAYYCTFLLIDNSPRLATRFVSELIRPMCGCATNATLLKG